MQLLSGEKIEVDVLEMKNIGTILLTWAMFLWLNFSQFYFYFYFYQRRRSRWISWDRSADSWAKTATTSLFTDTIRYEIVKKIVNVPSYLVFTSFHICLFCLITLWLSVMLARVLHAMHILVSLSLFNFFRSASGICNFLVGRRASWSIFDIARTSHLGESCS